MDQFGPWQVIPRQVFTPYSRFQLRLLLSVALKVVSRVGCLGVTDVVILTLLVPWDRQE